MRKPRDGEDGWELLLYRWRERDEIGTFVYEKHGPGGRVIEQREIKRYQPVLAALGKRSRLFA